jgi:hypothetical protein
MVFEVYPVDPFCVPVLCTVTSPFTTASLGGTVTDATGAVINDARGAYEIPTPD